MVESAEGFAAGGFFCTEFNMEDFESMGFNGDEDSPLAIAGEEPGEVSDVAQRHGVHSKTPPSYCRGASISVAQRVGESVNAAASQRRRLTTSAGRREMMRRRERHGRKWIAIQNDSVRGWMFSFRGRGI